MQARRYTVEIHTQGVWLMVAEGVTKTKALATLKSVEAEAYDARLWSEAVKPNPPLPRMVEEGATR